MPYKSLEISVNPEVLKWARRSIGQEIKDVANSLKITEQKLIDLESGKENPTSIQLEKFANIYKRPSAVFFLSKPPKEAPLPNDFRTLPSNRERYFSSKIILTLRRARRIQSLAKEINRDLGHLPDYKDVQNINLRSSPEISAKTLREDINTSVEEQFKWKNEKEAFNCWVSAIERFGILILQASLPMEEARAFSLATHKPFVIILNSRDSVRGRIFSLFHEYCHLMIGRPGVCDIHEQEGLSDEIESVEKFCNHFAGAFLVPEYDLLNHEIFKDGFNKITNHDLEILSNNFKVSQEVILRRLLLFNKVSTEFYKQKHEQWEEAMQELRRRKSWWRVNPVKKSIQENGSRFTSLVFNAYWSDKITYRDVSDYLSTRLKYLSVVEKTISNK